LGVTTVPPPPATGTITVFAASSLTGAYTEIGQAFQAANPGATVKFNFAASSTLATQINQGAPADIFASADDANMKKITDTGLNLGSPVEFATNKLQVIVGKGNPLGITSVTDLAKPNVITVTCDPSVPIGAYTQQVFQKAGITVKPKSLEPDVKGIVTKVTTGAADAGVVYATDVLAAGSSAQGVVIPDQLNVIANYPLSVVRGTKDAYSAQVFMNYVLGKDGQAILAKWAFTSP
jgi:molybdate transport system substrate-binding protein